jgi:CelD/BcsL family acetyltransferase involved in cellulose biosynthesis
MSIAIRWCSPVNLDANSRAAWSELGQQAQHPSPFLLPQFIVPAARWLTPGRPPRIALFERIGRGPRELVGVGCFTAEQPALYLPVPHWRGYRTRHSFRTGLLVTPQHGDAVAEALLWAIRHGVGAPRSHAILFGNVLERDDGVAALRRVALAEGGSWHEMRRFARPVLHVRDGVDAAQAVPSKVLKNLRRHRRRLEELGRVEARVLQGHGLEPAAAERFLQLERSGWKGAKGSALRCSQAGTAFFRDMVAQFSQIGAAVFVETLLGDQVIGSTSNFLVGGTLSAFKIGWDPRYAKHSPGCLTKLAALEALAGTWPGVHKFDSNAQEKSWLAQMLPHTETVVSGMLATTRLGTMALTATRLVLPLAGRLGAHPFTERSTQVEWTRPAAA